MSTRVGGTGEVRDVTEAVREIAEKMRDEAEIKAGTKFSMYQPLKFCSQVVAGVNYFIKVQVTEAGECVHLRVYQDLQQSLSLASVLTNKSVDDPIAYF